MAARPDHGSRRDDPAEHAADAFAAWAALQRRFGRPPGRRPGYRRSAGRSWPGADEHVWPLARAFVAALDLAGIPPARRPPAAPDPDAVIGAHLDALQRYLDPGQHPVAYRSDPVGARWGGDRYYDDNAWIGLGLVQLQRLRPGRAGLERAGELFRFACHGWDERMDVPVPGGVFWVEQGRGVGRRNHDRNTVSNAPNAQLGLHLALLGAAGEREIDSAERMIDWVHRALATEGGTLFRDKIRGDGSVDVALWSYNQGSMAGAELLRHRLGREGALARAQAIARAVLAWPPARLRSQPPAFNAILLRNLLAVAAAGPDAALTAAVREQLRGYAGWLTAQPRDRHGLTRARGRRPTVLDQSGLVSVLALLAWDPEDYGHLV
ncbi:MAG TPA: glycoside hydrolase family 76 protein [Solirubrobacteraceae bacterium]|nr:glycoside hydrolase family 76 protein [Solirubrobacteraceae bacterium]